MSSKGEKRSGKQKMAARRAPDLPPDAEPNFQWDKDYFVTRIWRQIGDFCWAFAIAGMIEVIYNIKVSHFEKASLSIQELINCVKKTQNQKKKPESVYLLKKALKWVDKNGLSREGDCPYVGRAQYCGSKRQPLRAIEIDKYTTSEGVNENELIELILQHPVAATLNVCNEFSDLKGDDIYKGSKLQKQPHAVIITGYGTDENGTHYWIIRNSYGRGWGRDGYGRLVRSCSNGGRSLFTSFAYAEVNIPDKKKARS